MKTAPRPIQKGNHTQWSSASAISSIISMKEDSAMTPYPMPICCAQ
jgi:hypothetical protein